MKSAILAVLGFLLAGAPASAVESVPEAPVKITSCVVARDFSGSFDVQHPIPNSNGVTIVFVNTSTKAIKDIQFSGVYNGLTISDKFAGPFASGQTVKLHKYHRPLAYEGPDAKCVVKHVTYEDGTSWESDGAPPTKP